MKPARRPAHRVGHPECRHANWADCDAAYAARHGTCKAMVSPKSGEPRPCTNNALEADGWCGLHFASEIERQRKAARQAVIAADLNERIEAYIAMSAADPWHWLKNISPSRDAERGLPPYHKSVPVSRVRRKGPHRIG